MTESLKTAKSQVRRVPSRGIYNREQVYEILDQTFLCHIAYNRDGQPFMIPTSYGRKGDTIYLHGSVKSQMMTTLGQQLDLCFCVTFMDGLVMARSAFHHSVNYRTVILYGKAEAVLDDAEKNEGLRVITEQVMPGRWDEIRQPNAAELKATAVLKFKIEEGAAKIRAEGVKDDKEDMDLGIWAGVVPTYQQLGTVIPDPQLPQDITTSKSVIDYYRNFSNTL